MRHSRRYRERETEETQIDISPLIDVVFILVIFFIVTTVFNKRSGLDIDPPAKQTLTKELESEAVHLEIDVEGNVYYSNENIGVEGIATVVASQQDGREAVTVIVKPDAQTSAEHLMRVYNAAYAAKAKTVAIQTKNKE